MRNFIIRNYFLLYTFIAKNRISENDLSERHIHAHLVCVLVTGFLMWAYAILAYFTINHPLPWIVGLIASLIHLFSPLLFRFNNNRFFNTNVFLAAGMAHQSTFAFFCGGFLSNIIIWFGILPMLAGFVCGKRGVVTWVIVTTFATSVFLILQTSGYTFPHLISPVGLLYSQALITFGWLYTSAVIITVFLFLTEERQKEIEAKNEGIKNLICVITHDISNPLTVIFNRINMLKKIDLPQNINESVTKISSATTNIIAIINSVRNLYATELGKNRIELTEVNLKEILISLKDNFSDKLEAKKIILALHFKSNDQYLIKSNSDLLLNQILANLLTNAIKFSPEESNIEIKLENNKNSTFIFIRDFGIGIPKELMPKLFDITAQTNRRGTSGENGTGFGLLIVKTYIEKLSGKIQIESTPAGNLNQGTTIKLEFHQL